jgi:3-dehydroquinate synthetase/shikimate kinase
MGSGKTSVGKRLAEILRIRFSDLDRRIVEREERSIAALFAQGEARFREAEAEAIRAWLNRPAQAPAEILALGGGALEHRELIEPLRARGTIVGLTASADCLIDRLRNDGLTERPLLSADAQPTARLASLIEARRDGYARAECLIDTEGQDIDHVATAVLRSLYHADHGPWRQELRPLGGATEGDCAVTVARGGLAFPSVRRAAVLIDRHLPDVHVDGLLASLGARAESGLVLLREPGGEECKSSSALLRCWNELLAAGVDRDHPLWVIGGGTITDLGGFVAHSFKRGLALHLLPTTLLGQLDAALGGKNGINLDRAKNVIGTTRLPASVQIDPLFLLTLPEVELIGAMSEAIKSAVIGDPALLELIERGVESIRRRELELLEAISARAAAVKLGIVARDLHEQQERRLLNFGHTLGHALETFGARRDQPITHGQAVAMGMVFATYLAMRLGVLEDTLLIERIIGLLKRLGLPTAGPLLDDQARQQLLELIALDKKRHSGENVWVLPVRAGRLVCQAVSDRDVLEALEQFT